MSKKEESLPKVNYFMGVVSILLIGAGYYIGITDSNQGLSLPLIPVVTILVVWGTYWLFGAFFPMVIRYLINKKSILYSGVNIVSLSNIAFRIRKNYRTLATIAVLAATTLTAFGTVVSLKYYVSKTHDIELPYSFSFISDDPMLRDKVRETIDEYGHKILIEEKINFLRINEIYSDSRIYDRNVAAIKYSDFLRVSKDLKPEALQDFTKLNPSISEVIYITNPGVIISGVSVEEKDITIGSSTYRVKAQIKTPLFGKGLNITCLIVHDDVYQKLKTRFEENVFNGIIVNDQKILWIWQLHFIK